MTTLDELHQRMLKEGGWRYRFWNAWYGTGGFVLVRWIRARNRLVESEHRFIRRIGALMWHLEMWHFSWEGCGWDCDVDEVYGFVPEADCPLHDHAEPAD